MAKNDKDKKSEVSDKYRDVYYDVSYNYPDSIYSLEGSVQPVVKEVIALRNELLFEIDRYSVESIVSLIRDFNFALIINTNNWLVVRENQNRNRDKNENEKESLEDTLKIMMEGNRLFINDSYSMYGLAKLMSATGTINRKLLEQIRNDKAKLPSLGRGNSYKLALTHYRMSDKGFFESLIVEVKLSNFIKVNKDGGDIKPSDVIDEIRVRYKPIPFAKRERFFVDEEYYTCPFFLKRMLSKDDGLGMLDKMKAYLSPLYTLRIKSWINQYNSPIYYSETMESESAISKARRNSIYLLDSALSNKERDN